MSGPVTRLELEQREEARLHRLAQRSRLSRGRHHPEPPHPYRTDFQRDRDRILHAAAFRRLQYKTQVFFNLTVGQVGEFRTRLTHTLEVAQTARVIATALGFHEDLTEAIAYAHDLGHPPFGHAGEKTLARLMRQAVGRSTDASPDRVTAPPFDHNAQALRIVDVLERRYPEFAGLNLTFELRAGLMKHERTYADCPPADAGSLLAFAGRRGSFEARIVDLADRLAYLCHDLEDALTAGILTVDQLEELDLVTTLASSRGRRYRDLPSEEMTFILVRDLKDWIVTDLVTAASEALTETPPGLPTTSPPHLIDYSPQVAKLLDATHAFLMTNYYASPRIVRTIKTLTEYLEHVFTDFLNHPEGLPARFTKATLAAQHVSRPRLVCDYVASLSDRQLLDRYLELTR